jgi:NAD(P)H-dependent flavin oxidoreductase YrpB (nitropropane dioxygenase family)
MIVAMRTPLCDRLGIEFPIFAFSHCRDVVAAVSRAGGFGVLGAVAFSPDQLEVELDWIDGHVGDKPYGVDIIVPAKYTGIEQGGMTRKELGALIPDEHRAFVDGLMAKYGVDALPSDEAPRHGAEISGRAGEDLMGFSHESGHRLLDIVWAHPKVRLVANALGPAPDFLVAEAHERGVMVAGLVGTVVHAERQQAAGVDLVIAQGSEAGGHTGEIGTMVLVPQVVDAVSPTPVLAAGGIADGRQIVAALALGAQGVWCGSVWLTTEEAETHPVVKEKFLAATSADTLRSRSKTGKHARQLRSSWTDEWSDPANPEPLGMPLQMILVGEAEQRIARTAGSNEGSRRLINYFVGQAVGMMNESKPATAVVFDLVEQYLDAAGRIAATIADD